MAKRLKIIDIIWLCITKVNLLMTFSNDASLKHVFDDHLYCVVDLYGALQATIQGKTYNHPKNKLVRLKMGRICIRISAPSFKSIETKILKYSIHPCHTQTNEAINNSQACITPKSKAIRESQTFHYLHYIIIRTHNWGYQ